MTKLIKRLRSKKRGFTLVELIVVIAILAILAAILVPTMLGVLNDSKTTVANANAKSIFTAAQSAYVLTTANKGAPTGTEITSATVKAATGTLESATTADEYFARTLRINLGNDYSGTYTIKYNANGIESVTYKEGNKTEGKYSPVSSVADEDEED